MELLIEQIAIYLIVGVFCFAVIWYYIRKQSRSSKAVEQKIEDAKVSGLFEPVSLHPVVDVNSCIKSGACVVACPEKDILGIVNGKATTINASECIGHGACFHACPVEAITLCIGTEERGVDLPHINQDFETNVPGIFIAGELGGMGLIKNAVEQGKQTIENIYKSKKRGNGNITDVLIVGSGPAGIAAALMCKKLKLSFELVEQDTLGGTVFTFPREKVVMTSPMHLPLYGKMKLYETSKEELLTIWKKVLTTNQIPIHEKTKVESIIIDDNSFLIDTNRGKEFRAGNVLLAVGRRGTPRKLKVPGEDLSKVAYRLLEPERIKNKEIIVVGGGDSAIESALLLANENNVALSYRKNAFSRLKPKNRENIKDAIDKDLIKVYFDSNVESIHNEDVKLKFSSGKQTISIKNDLIYIFAGGELPTSFLEKTGIQITKRFGYALMKH